MQTRSCSVHTWGRDKFQGLKFERGQCLKQLLYTVVHRQQGTSKAPQTCLGLWWFVTTNKVMHCKDKELRVMRIIVEWSL